MLVLDRSSRSSLLGVVLFAVLGPAIGYFGELVFWYLQAEVVTSTAADLLALSREFAAFLPIAYAVGSVPALLAGVLYIAVGRASEKFLHRWSFRALLGGAVGALAAYLIAGLFFGLSVDTTLRAGFAAGLVCGFLVRITRGDDAQQCFPADAFKATRR